MYLDEYKRWLAAELEDADLKPELAKIEGNDDEIKDRFAVALKFGTAGLRGVLGAGTNRMNIYVVRQATQGLANWVKTQGGTQTVAISYDSRLKSDIFAKTAAGVLAANGIKVRIYDALMPVPALSFATRYYNCNAGIMVTASHNPAKYNGYKAYGPDGCQMTDEPAAIVYQRIEEIPYFVPAAQSFDFSMAKRDVEFIAPELWEEYYQTVLAERVTDVPSDNLNLLYTPLCGTGNKPVRTVLGRIGVHVDVVKAQEQPDGDFKTCEYPNPETDAALNESYKIARSTHPDLILGTDPDCDRVAVAVPAGDGFRKLSGNELGCLLLDYILGELTAKGRLPADPVAVRSIVSSPMADKVAAKYGVKMRSVLTGFKYIGGEILALEEKGEENRFVFGFEESCGYLKGTYARDKDAVVASMLTADLAAKLKREGMNLADQIDALYAELGYHDAKVISIELKGPNAMELSAKFMKDFRAEIPTELGGVRVTSCTDYLSRVRTELATGATEPVLLPKSNVVALELGESGSVIVRPSGTEPKVKLYLTAVDRDPKRAAALLERLAEDMKRLAGC